MQILPVDLTAIVAVIMGVSIVLVPVIGLTARFALKPLVESMGHFFQAKGVEENVRILERRMVLLEQQLESMDASLRRLAEVAEFNDELRSRPAAPGLGPGGAPRSGGAGERG